MKRLNLKIITLITGVLVLSSCGKKYPDGGKINQAKDNIQGTWKLTNYLVDGTDRTSELIITGMTEIYTEGTTEGEGTLTRSYTDSNGDLQSQNGSYKFDTEYTQLDVDGIGSIEFVAGVGTASTSTNDVLMLKSDEYRYSFTNGGSLHELRFTKQ